MSSTPPPLPPHQPQQWPQQSQPQPVISLAYEVPVVRDGLPGGIIAVSIISIIFGVIWVLGAIAGLVMLERSGPSSSPQARPVVKLPPVPPANVVPYDGDYIRPGGMHAAARAAVLEAVGSKTKLSPDRTISLDRFLRDAGSDAFAGADPAQVAARVTEVRQATDGPDGTGALGSHFISTPLGTIELCNRFAAFTPANTDRTTHRTEAFKYTGPDGRARWAAATLASWIERRREQKFGPLSAQQATVILDFAAQLDVNIMRNSQDPFYLVAGTEPSLTIVPRNQGYIQVTSPLHGNLILADGRTANPSEYLYGFDPLTLEPISADPNLSSELPPDDGSAAVLKGIKIQTMFNIPLAIVGFCAGLCVLLKLRNAPRVHRWWALVKVVAVTSEFSLAYVYEASLVTGQSNPFILVGIVLQGVIAISVLWAYSFARAKSFYERRGESIALFPPAFPRRWRMVLASPPGKAFINLCCLAAACIVVLNIVGIAGGFTRPDPESSDLTHYASLAVVACLVLVMTLNMRRRTSAAVAVIAVIAVMLIVSAAPSRAADPTTAPTTTATRPVGPRDELIDRTLASTNLDNWRVLESGMGRTVRYPYQSLRFQLSDKSQQIGRPAIPPVVNDAHQRDVAIRLLKLVSDRTDASATPGAGQRLSDRNEPLFAELEQMFDDPDPVVREQAARVIEFRYFFSTKLDDQMKYLVHPVAEVRRPFLAALLDPARSTVSLPDDLLIPWLDSSDGWQRRVAIQRLLERDMRESKIDAATAFRLLDSPHSDMQLAIAAHIFRKADLREHAGYDTADRIARLRPQTTIRRPDSPTVEYVPPAPAGAWTTFTAKPAPVVESHAAESVNWPARVQRVTLATLLSICGGILLLVVYAVATARRAADPAPAAAFPVAGEAENP